MSAPREVIVCPLCRSVIHERVAHPITERARVSSRTDPQTAAALLTAMVMDSQKIMDEIVQRAEEACRSHLETKHPRRFRLWQKYGWEWVLLKRWPWSKQFTSGDDFSFAVKP